MHQCILIQAARTRKKVYIMARITVTLPDNLHQKITELAGKENDSISYTVSKLVDIGLMVMNSKNEKKEDELNEYCQKLIIQINGILKELAVDKFNIENDKITKITNETLVKFNRLKGIHEEPL
jgi:hypothetical protein